MVAVSQKGMLATCPASSPSDMDFACGFHWNCASGTRSSSRRVVASSWSYSGRSELAMLIEPFYRLSGRGESQRPKGNPQLPGTLEVGGWELWLLHERR